VLDRTLVRAAITRTPRETMDGDGLFERDMAAGARCDRGST
jgi:hypothetical protein